MTAHTLKRRFVTGAPVAAVATLALAAGSPGTAVAQDRCQAEALADRGGQPLRARLLRAARPG